MSHTVKQIDAGWTVATADGRLLSENGHSFLRGNGFGVVKIWAGSIGQSKALAVAEWLSVDGRERLTKSQRRNLRNEIVARHNLPTEMARGLLQ